MNSLRFSLVYIALVLVANALSPQNAAAQSLSQPSVKPQITLNTPKSSAPINTFAKGPWTLPTCGFSLSLPAGWLAEKGGMRHRVLSCMLPDKSGGPRQIILVQMGTSEAKTLRGHADSLAKPGQSQILAGARPFDKKAALVLKLWGENPGLTKKWAQQRAIVTRQGKQTFTIGIFADAGEKIDATVEALFKGWQWQPFADPTRYLLLRSVPSSFEQGRLKISLPETMQTVSVEPAMTMVGINDARTGVWALTLSVALIPTPKPVDFTVLRNNFSALIKQQLELEKEMVWHSAAGQPNRALSDFVQAPASVSEAGYRSQVAYGLVQLPENKMAILTFTMTGQTAPSQALYSAAVKKMFATVQVGKPTK